MKRIELNLICCFNGGGASAPLPTVPNAPSKDVAAQNLLQQGMKKAPIGFTDTILGNNKKQPSGGVKTLLGE